MQIFNKYEKDYMRACDKFLEERERFGEGLRRISFLRVVPSQANYFLCEVLSPHTARGVVLAMLKKHNILLRDCSNKIGFEGGQFIRIAIRNKEDNNKLLRCLSEIY